MTRAQKKFQGQNGVTFMVDIDSVLDDIATGDALTESLKDSRYLDAIIDESFEVADEAFNLLAESAGRTGEIAHMYEWGTIGINNGRSNVRMQPSSIGARLWHTFNQGTGKDRMVSYAFRPSVANVPKPTVKETGMSSDVINAMRDHVFTWKSKVMENGEKVTIKPKNAKALLIPGTEKNRPYFSDTDKKRGYMMTRNTITTTPGAGTQNKFTVLWQGFWIGAGNDIMQESVIEMIKSDYQPEFRTRRNAGSLRPVGTMDVRRTIKKKSAATQKRALARAKLRRATKR